MKRFFNSNGREYLLLSQRKDYSLCKNIKTGEFVVANGLKAEKQKIENTKDFSYQIKKMESGNFVVLLNDEIDFESFSRAECVKYIYKNQIQESPKYYVIEDVSDTNSIKSNPKRYDSLQEALENFKKLRNNNYDWTDNKAKLVLGTSLGKMERDIIQVRNNENCLINDCFISSKFNTNLIFLENMGRIEKNINIDKVFIINETNGVITIPYFKWENPYFNKDVSLKTYSWEHGSYFFDKKNAIEYYKEKTDENYYRKIIGYERLLNNLKGEGFFTTLKAMCSGVITLNHRFLEDKERDVIKSCLEDNFKDLDKMGVSFRVQNAIIDKAEKMDVQFETIVKEIYKNFSFPKDFLNSFAKDQCPALKHLSTKGKEDLNLALKDNLYKKNIDWDYIKNYIYNEPDFKDLKNEINECKIREQRILNQNKNLLQEMSV